MKRTYKYALTAVLGAVIVAPAVAQDNFPDVPDNHWAYEALARMKRDGLLVGYPDGLFRGGRPASRYEMAVAIHATYVHLKNITDSLQSQIDALKGGNTDDLRAAIAALQNDVNALKGMRGDLDNLKRMVDTFQKELQALGVDVEAMKRDLGDLNARVEALEKRKPAVDISGDVNLWLGAGHTIDNNANGALNRDGRTAGIVGNGGAAGITRDLSILHEAAITLAGTNETGPKWRGTFVIGNMTNDGNNVAFGNQSSFLGAIGTGGRSRTGYSEPDSDWYVQDLGIKFDTSLAGLAFNAEAGRVGYKINPLYFQRPDNTSYYANERWDDGLWRFDGAILGFNFGGAKLDVFGGKNSLRTSTNGVDLNPMVLGATDPGGSINNYVNDVANPVGNGANPMPFGTIRADRSLGASLNIPLSTAGNVNIAYIFLDSDFANQGPNGRNYNRVNVLGGNVNYNVGSLKLEGGAAQTDISENGSSRITSDNTAFYGKLSYTQPNWNVFAGYREIGRFYSAPGDWGRVGIIRNPVNIKGFQVGGAIDFSRGLSLSATGEFYKGKDDQYTAGGAAAGANTPWDTDSEVTTFNVRLGYNVTSNLSLGVGYEENRFNDIFGANGAALADPRFRWTTFDLGYGLSETARLLLRYELSDHDNIPALGGLNGGQYRGGFLTTQLSLKF
jgi:hypothetical protein